MKDYIKPTIEIVELRPEERLATCHIGLSGPDPLTYIWEMIFCRKSRCKLGYTSAGGCS
ncbi:hypothetical protein R2R35_10235 [Anaerocolumna sp. AGMB13020]|uniref:hypothetical protein n=1 Tax=Anaerocolumna sp. AGMB13020 TaxID=3081750 RepID=UPI0029540333|nr:hypothetical protein [Anaerocolumna sp. AGMB13020]WOO38834.1 hypothetical protein R2R35_10235 [Anaerocolumna sp. AGMB13020]